MSSESAPWNCNNPRDLKKVRCDRSLPSSSCSSAHHRRSGTQFVYQSTNQKGCEQGKVAKKTCSTDVVRCQLGDSACVVYPSQVLMRGDGSDGSIIQKTFDAVPSWTSLVFDARRGRIGASSSGSLSQNEISNNHPFGDFAVGSISPITCPIGKNANGTHFNCSIETRYSSSLLTHPGSNSTSSIEKSKESAKFDVDFQFNNEDTVEWSNTTFFQDETDVDKLLEVVSMLDNDGKTGLPSSKDQEQLKGSVRRKRGRKPETSPYQSEQVAVIQKFLELRSQNNTDMAHWATIADSELVYTSPGLPPQKGSAGMPMKKREVRGLDAVAFDMDVYRMFSNSLTSHFAPRRVTAKVSLELEPNDVLVTGDKGMATVFLRVRGLQSFGLRKLEKQGMLFCQFKPGTSRLTSLELSVDMAQLALKISPYLKILLSPIPVAGSLAVLGSPGPCEGKAATGRESPTIDNAPLAYGGMGASEHAEDT